MTSRCDSPIILCNVWNIDRIEYIQRRYVSSNFITSITVTFLVWLCLNSASAATHSQPHYFPDLVNIRIYSSSFHTHVLFLFFFLGGVKNCHAFPFISGACSTEVNSAISCAYPACSWGLSNIKLPTLPACCLIRLTKHLSSNLPNFQKRFLFWWQAVIVARCRDQWSVKRHTADIIIVLQNAFTPFNCLAANRFEIWVLLVTPGHMIFLRFLQKATILVAMTGFRRADECF